MFWCTAALPSEVARLTAVEALFCATGLFVLTACSLRCLNEGAVFD